MAIMIPAAISKFDTEGERKVYNYLKDNLSDRYIVLYNLRSEITGLIDFIIVCPSGILGIEVKDWSAAYIKSCTTEAVYLNNLSNPVEEYPVKTAQDRIWKLVKNQIRKSSWLMTILGKGEFCYSGVAWYVNLDDSELKEKLSRSKQRNNNTIQQLTSDDFWELDAEALIDSCLEHRGRVYTRNLTDAECLEIKNFILQEKTIHVTFSDLVIELDKQQMQYARNMDYGQYIIRGAGGTGKTVRLIGRAIYLAETHADYSILFVTSKNDLADLIDPNFQGYSNLYLYTKHQLFCNINNILADKFNVILIDELQDFSKEDIKAIKSLLFVPDKSHFIGAIDGAQNTYKNQYDLLDIADKIDLLTQNYRNGDKILSYVQSIGQTCSSNDNNSSSYYSYYNQTISYHTNVGEVYNLDLTMEDSHLLNPNLYNEILIIIQRHSDLSLKEIAIINIGYNQFLNSVQRFICDNNIPIELNFSSNDSIKLLNNNSTKGLEFKLVILLVNSRITNLEQSKILACSRASQYLYVIDY